MPVSIEIFGVRGFVYDAIRSKLQEHLDSAGFDYVIQDVQKIDEFIAEGIESVPTVRVDHKKSFTKTEDTTPEQIVDAVVDYIHAHSVQCVLCPVDFSEHSLHAAKWALQFAKLMRIQLKLLHVYKPITEVSYTLTADPTALLTSLKAKLTELSRQISNGTSIIPLTSVEVGDPLQTIVRISKEPSTALIIMGTQGTTHITRKIFGTISSAVARHTYAPVLLIPPDIQYKKPEHIMVAFHEVLLTNGALSKLVEFNRPLGAHLQFVHVQEEFGTDYITIRDRLLDKLTNHVVPDFSFDVQVIHPDGEPVLHALLQHAEETQPGIIVFVTRQRNLIQRLMSPGLTQRMSAHLKWPLLVMHRN